MGFMQSGRGFITAPIVHALRCDSKGYSPMTKTRLEEDYDLKKTIQKTKTNATHHNTTHNMSWHEQHKTGPHNDTTEHNTTY